ncbi:inner membrane protein YtfF [Enterobacter cancerogenus]|uniref:Inner membrane protein YtfF n=1 Tax=Enterobacter cancerogenus TaxID=69218 RepID=A0A484XW20_9ENTR|nr:inner membrane protein YtfF [Enterobacter cancerogenus]
MMGNLIYYACLASAIQRTGAPVSTMIIGTLPVVIPVFANLLYSQRDGKLAWSKMLPALVCIAVGLICVNVAELRHGLADFSLWRYGSGIFLAFISVVCWAWYALRNARWLRENPDKHPMMWATAQALVTLPVSLVGYAGACLWLGSQQSAFALPLGPRPWVFVGLMIAIAVLCSWVGALCWNIASQKLPTVILGPLIVFENPRRAALHLPDAPERAAAVNSLRDRVAGDWGGDSGEGEAGKTEGCSGVGGVSLSPGGGWPYPAWNVHERRPGKRHDVKTFPSSLQMPSRRAALLVRRFSPGPLSPPGCG